MSTTVLPFRDPYRWLEDPSSAGSSCNWIEAQNESHLRLFGEHIPQRGRLKARLTQLWNYERYSTPFKRGGCYFFYKNDGLQNQSVLYTLPTLDAEPAGAAGPQHRCQKMARWRSAAPPLVRMGRTWPMASQVLDLTGSSGKLERSQRAKTWLTSSNG